MEDKDVPLEPERTKKAVNMNTKKDPLETVIEAINEVYKGSFTEADRVLIGTLREKLLADKKLRKAAKSDGQQIFEKNVFPRCSTTPRRHPISKARKPTPNSLKMVPSTAQL